MNNTNPYFAFETFDLLIGSGREREYPLSVTQSPAGDARGICQLNPADETLQAMLHAFEDRKANEELQLRLGDQLFDALLTGDISAIYRSSLNLVRGRRTQLRIRLIVEPPELAVVPWEYLHDRQEDAWLAISPETALVRYIPIQVPAHPTVTHPPLRVLVVVASPKDLQSLDSQREQAIIQEALSQWTAQDLVSLYFVEQPTISSISQAMRELRPHVFHFVGHGSFLQDEAYIFLEDEAGNARPVSERTFREFFIGHPETRLAVFNACQTATTSAHQILFGLAPRLLQRQLSAVVAMQYPIADTAALIFTREFYRSLALGYPIEAAISEARRGIYLEVAGQTLDWGIPVLFLPRAGWATI